MKLFTRLAIVICCSTIIPLLLLRMTMDGLISYELNIILLLLIGLILLFWIYSSILRPLDKLRQATRKIKNGDLDFTLDIEKNDEIGELTEDFEDMRIRLRESQQEKIKSDKESKELISNIAHDLKTPITTIRGYAEGIMDGVASTPEMVDKYVHTIYNKANDMTGLIEELTFYSKIDTNRIPYDFKKLNIRSYFNDCAAETGLDMEGKNIIFSYNSDVTEDTVVIADPEQLRKVINNIIGNSVKYMVRFPGHIFMELSDKGDVVQCNIEDDGKGVEKQELTKIFERFYRTDVSRNSEKGGSGIGLSIVKKIIEDHGGRIWATCEEGHGLAVHFILRKYFED